MWEAAQLEAVLCDALESRRRALVAEHSHILTANEPARRPMAESLRMEAQTSKGTSGRFAPYEERRSLLVIQRRAVEVPLKGLRAQ